MLRSRVRFERFDRLAVNGDIQHDQVGVDFEDGRQHRRVILSLGHAHTVCAEVVGKVGDADVVVNDQDVSRITIVGFG